MGSLGTKIGENIDFLRDRVADIDKLAAHMGNLIDETTRLEQITSRLEDLTNQLAVGAHISREATEQIQAITDDARDNLANFDATLARAHSVRSFKRYRGQFGNSTPASEYRSLTCSPVPANPLIAVIGSVLPIDVKLPAAVQKAPAQKVLSRH